MKCTEPKVLNLSKNRNKRGSEKHCDTGRYRREKRLGGKRNVGKKKDRLSLKKENSKLRHRGIQGNSEAKEKRARKKDRIRLKQENKKIVN